MHARAFTPSQILFFMVFGCTLNLSMDQGGSGQIPPFTDSSQVPVKKVLCIGNYDYGNIGDLSYKMVFEHYLKVQFEPIFVPNVARINGEKKYISMRSKEVDIDFDALIIGGGGILEDFYKDSNSIHYYAEKAIEKKLPLIFASIGFQTDNPQITAFEARERLGKKTISLLEKSHLVMLRTYRDYVLLQHILEQKDMHKVLVYPDFGYLLPNIALSGSEKTKPKRFISLIQTGSVNLKMQSIRKLIEEKLMQHNHTELAIINMGGVEMPSQEKDFKEWDLFTAETIQKYFPQADIIASPSEIPLEPPSQKTIYVFKGDSLSPQLKNDFYLNQRLRPSDLTPKSLLTIMAQSDFVITGRLHGYKFAQALKIPCQSPIYTYKMNAEKENHTNIAYAENGIQLVINTLLHPRQLMSPMLWGDNQRNKMILWAHDLYPQHSIPLLQGRDNKSLFNLIAYGMDY